MTLSNATGIDFSTFRVEKIQQMYHLHQPVKRMDPLFYVTHSFVIDRGIVKSLMKELSRLRQKCL